MFDIDAALRHLVEIGGSDLHLKAAACPTIRVNGELRAIEDSQPLTSEDTSSTFKQIVKDPGLLDEFERDGEADFSYSVAGVSRFRVNAFRQRGSTALALPRDSLPGPHRRGPRPAAGDQRPRRRAARDRPAHRDDRLGQVDDARGDGRPHQLDPVAQHHHPRGPDRVPAQGQAVDHQPARGRPGHRELRPRDAPHPAPGPRRDPDRRDARRGDGAHRAVGGGDRPPRALDPPHPRRDRDRQPDHRLLPAASPAAGARHARLDAARRRWPAARSQRRREEPGRRLRDPRRLPAASRT